ncbi:SseB family protein [Actinomadura madurae]|uniref:SseB family protein n=1 Tax=Actinomadura madurae TaxID=1993 RepID=UPI0020D2358A|nr:SseB family protein [Actinomadura madurae]MCQ0015348.1 SseB family protein [Actinomadura madurae]
MATVADAWRPTSELEHRLQETVRAGDQESYFRLLADSELVVPVPPEAVDGVLAGEAQPSWPTQEEDGRVHVLVYTSASAMRACMGPSYQHFMTVRFGDIAETWPDSRWWLAIDAPAHGVGTVLPIEARMPSWFIRQVAEGDGRPPQVGRVAAPWEELRDQHRDLPRETSRTEFQPANDVERDLLRAASTNDHDLFLQTLADTEVLLPVPDDLDFSLRPGRPGFPLADQGGRRLHRRPRLHLARAPHRGRPRRRDRHRVHHAAVHRRAALLAEPRLAPRHQLRLPRRRHRPRPAAPRPRHLGRPARRPAHGGPLRTAERHRAAPPGRRPPPRHRRLLQDPPRRAGPGARRHRHPVGHRPGRRRVPVAARPRPRPHVHPAVHVPEVDERGPRHVPLHHAEPPGDGHRLARHELDARPEPGHPHRRVHAGRPGPHAPRPGHPAVRVHPAAPGGAGGPRRPGRPQHRPRPAGARGSRPHRARPGHWTSARGTGRHRPPLRPVQRPPRPGRGTDARSTPGPPRRPPKPRARQRADARRSPSRRAGREQHKRARRPTPDRA